MMTACTPGSSRRTQQPPHPQRHIETDDASRGPSTHGAPIESTPTPADSFVATARPQPRALTAAATVLGTLASLPGARAARSLAQTASDLAASAPLPGIHAWSGPAPSPATGANPLLGATLGTWGLPDIGSIGQPSSPWSFTPSDPYTPSVLPQSSNVLGTVVFVVGGAIAGAFFLCALGGIVAVCRRGRRPEGQAAEGADQASPGAPIPEVELSHVSVQAGREIEMGIVREGAEAEIGKQVVIVNPGPSDVA